ncbi:MAG: tRNA pseudouridine(38-40) synthase TruA [Pseudomonadota bacterium]
MTRIALGLEYDGTRFYGWQTQAQTPTVQATLELALASVADAPVRIIGAGRTDTGVHARCQVAHMDPANARDLRAWVLGTNTQLPDDVRVRWAQPVDDEFHARFSALSRRYRYHIYNRPVRPALNRQTLTWIGQPLDAEAMHEAAQALLGEQDFSAFRARACQARHPVRRVLRVSVVRSGEHVTLDIEANAFLHHMVRNIVGSLIKVGKGQEAPGWVAELLRGKDRTRAGPTAPPQGLQLHTVHYPERYNLPR